MKSMKRIVAFAGFGLLIFTGLASAAELNLAKPDKYPYADLKGGRDGYSLAKEKVNEARLYEFYARQADYYMANPDKIPEVIPSYPGLDGAVHGHWGKNNQNNHNDGRWNKGDQGEHFTHVVKGKGFNILKGICVKLGDGHVLSTCFDPQSLSYRVVWDGWIRFEPHRWGTSRNANVDEKPWFALAKAEIVEAVKTDQEVITFLQNCGEDNLQFLLQPEKKAKARGGELREADQHLLIGPQHDSRDFIAHTQSIELNIFRVL